MALTTDEGLAAVTVAAVHMMRNMRAKTIGNDHRSSSDRKIDQRWADNILGMLAVFQFLQTF